jgi:4-amino-4-deoxy-L-arabinose transferase-like glycosyltransferase
LQEPQQNTALFWAILLASVVLFLAPIRAGDLPGYDDALYAHIAKGIALTGDWLTPSSNGYPAFEHPPLYLWTQAALFRMFGIADVVAKLPSALAAIGCVALVYWLARRMLNDRLTGVLAMFALATTVYFIKYAARAMTDVPFTFLFLAAICAYVLSEDDPRWLLVAGAFTACAQMTRGLAGVALPMIFFAHAAIVRRRVPVWYAGAGLAIAFAPIGLWYFYQAHRFGQLFFETHNGWLYREVYGPLTPAWRRYTGLPEYVWMILKSYWPWLPAMLVGLVAAVRNPKLRLLPVWIAGMLLVCAAARSRVLRYMLPAYPAFSILAAIGIRRVFSEQWIERALKILVPAACVVVVVVAIHPQRAEHAAETRPVAMAAEEALPAQERIAFYDQGVARYDEMNQFQWYGDHPLLLLLDRAGVENVLREGHPAVMIVDEDAYRNWISGRVASQVLARSGHLVCVKLTGGITPSSGE